MSILRVVCVDSDQLLLEDTVTLLSDMSLVDEAKGFTKTEEAYAWLHGHQADVVLMETDMPGMSGLELAAKIKRQWPDITVAFLTAYPQYALNAFEIHADGYILKPASKERLEQEIRYAFSKIRNLYHGHVVVKTFGNFDCFVDGKLLLFRQAKCKELLAYLIDRRGSSVTRAEAFAVLWEDRPYDRSMQKQFDVIIRSLRATLKEYEIEEILETRSGSMRILPELIDCDMYRFCSGEAVAVNEYQGEYMNGYSWAELTEGYMTRKLKN